MMTDAEKIKFLLGGKTLRDDRWPSWCDRESWPDMGTLYETRLVDGQLKERYSCGDKNELMSDWYFTRYLPTDNCDVVQGEP
jgi:hypothetical protein